MLEIGQVTERPSTHEGLFLPSFHSQAKQSANGRREDTVIGPRINEAHDADSMPTVLQDNREQGITDELPVRIGLSRSKPEWRKGNSERLDHRM